MNIVIVAGGLGTRFKDLSVFPKVLLPLAEYNSILENYLENFSDYLFLVINEKFYDMTMNYLDVNNLLNKVKVFTTNNSNGSYNSIKDCIDSYDNFPNQNVLFVWSDLIIHSRPIEKENAIFTCDGEYRFKFDGESVLEAPNYDGNVPGVYFIKDLDEVFNIELDSKDNYDLIEAIRDSGVRFKKRELPKPMELRDKETYEKYACINFSSVLKTRFFNELKVDGDTLTKKAIDPKYYEIIEKEFNWYKYGYENITDFEYIVPNVDLNSFEDHSFKMEYLKDYKPLHKVLKETNSGTKVLEIYKNIQRTLNVLDSNILRVTRKTFLKDLKKEIIDKVIDRCESIKHMLINYNKEDLEHALNSAYSLLSGLEGDVIEYRFTHGDLNGSNLLVNPETLDVKLIDPRGYFGYSKLYGWKPYEYAKLLYCLYGYDSFNNDLQIYGKDWPKKLELADSIEFLNKKEYKVLVGVIYVALAGYISQDIMKANIAYEYGMKLLKKELYNVE